LFLIKDKPLLTFILHQQHAQQWEMRSNQEGNDPLGTTGHSGEAGSLEEAGSSKGGQRRD